MADTGMKMLSEGETATIPHTKQALARSYLNPTTNPEP